MIVSSLLQLDRNRVFTVAAAHFLAAILGLALIIVIHQTLFHQHLSLFQAGVAYSVLLPLLFLIGVGSFRMLSQLGADALQKLRLELAAQILNLPYEKQEALGGTRINSLLTQDLVTLGEAFRALPILAFNIALLVCSMGYLLWLSPIYFLFYVAVLMISFVTAGVLTKRSAQLMKQLRAQEEKINQNFSALVSGAKELKLNRHRSGVFFHQNLKQDGQRLTSVTMEAEKHNSLVINWITVLVFIVLGCLLLISGSGVSPEPSVMSGFVIMTLFIRGPIVSIASFMPSLMKGEVAWKQINELGFDISLNDNPDITQVSTADAVKNFKKLALNQIEYQYPTVDDEPGFKLGPVNFDVNANDIIFIIGGNGSGKSTLAKVLTGLYPSTAGNITINGNITDRTETVNQLFSGVFFDFHLFEQVIDATGQPADESVIRDWLKRLELEGKVDVEQARLSTLKLSQGQRKRLALMIAACEQRPVLLFDEWAADQDPHFRRVFYRSLLPYLKQQGKTVIAITHDDHYFDCADKLYKLDQGQLSPVNGSFQQLINTEAQPPESVTVNS